jgi:hypothetical protein
MDYKIILGIIAIAIGLVSYIPYFKDIFSGHTKPHMFSWFVWALLEGTAFFAQLSKGAGAGAWVTGTTSILCLSVFAVSLSRGEKNITTSDKLSLAGAMLGIILWYFSQNALTAVILVSVTDFLGFIPTFRKSYFKPHEETAKLYMMSVLKLIFSLLALKSFNLTTAIYPASMILTNVSFLVMVFFRRKSLASSYSQRDGIN